jgi:hypothetical protein
MEPVTLTLAGVAAVTVSEGIKFLYAQAGELLKRWWDKGDAQRSMEPEPSGVTLPPTAFDGTLHDPVVHYDVLSKCADELDDAYGRLAPYVNGVKPIGTADQKFLVLAEQLRSLLEAVLEQTITFKGEQRPPSGTRVDAHMKLDVLRGEATNVDLEGSGDVRSVVEAKTVEAGGKLTGVRVRTTSGPTK